MNKSATLASLLVIPIAAWAQAANTVPATPKTTPSDTVTVSAKGGDVRTVLCDLFGQAKKSFVVAPDIHFALYLSLDKIDFDEALLIVCHTARLNLDIQNGIYYVTKSANPSPTKPEAKATVKAAPNPLPKSVLARWVTTRLTRADIRETFAELGHQTEVTIEVAKSVPAYKLTVFLNHTSLKYALDRVTEAAHLHYRFTDNRSILIFASTSEAKPDAEVLVSFDKG